MPDSTKIEQLEDIKEKLPHIVNFIGRRAMWNEWHIGACWKFTPWMFEVSLGLKQQRFSHLSHDWSR
ncbi:Bgt-51646 [Blumeria graminis f. sp. tritici]|uniref:Bgt-51646 n=1 Tax=Blumeria graminis f. sp. tritici TaxID=62690 RepID=A0A9X9MP92_BLUGR|nr:Bgt-51646 [Blumeria graminis f. sp. tritici]